MLDVNAVLTFASRITALPLRLGIVDIRGPYILHRLQRALASSLGLSNVGRRLAVFIRPENLGRPAWPGPRQRFEIRLGVLELLAGEAEALKVPQFTS